MELKKSNIMGNEVLELLEAGKILETKERFFKKVEGRMYYSDNLVTWSKSVITNNLLITQKFNLYE